MAPLTTQPDHASSGPRGFVASNPRVGRKYVAFAPRVGRNWAGIVGSVNLRLAIFCLAVICTTGCGQKRVTINDTFPRGSYASPWVLDGSVWSGTPSAAAYAVGDEYGQWKAFEPERVWLAVYRHDTRKDNTLTVRAWSFPSAQQARRAYDKFRPENASQLKAGDEACWTRDGILIRWGRMIFDIFGRGPAGGTNPEQAVYLLAFFEKKMPRDLPHDPQ